MGKRKIVVAIVAEPMKNQSDNFYNCLIGNYVIQTYTRLCVHSYSVVRQTYDHKCLNNGNHRKFVSACPKRFKKNK